MALEEITGVRDLTLPQKSRAAVYDGFLDKDHLQAISGVVCDVIYGCAASCIQIARSAVCDGIFAEGHVEAISTVVCDVANFAPWLTTEQAERDLLSCRRRGKRYATDYLMREPRGCFNGDMRRRIRLRYKLHTALPNVVKQATVDGILKKGHLLPVSGVTVDVHGFADSLRSLFTISHWSSL